MKQAVWFAAGTAWGGILMLMLGLLRAASHRDDPQFRPP